MTREDKKLLLKDLCARLPYKVKASYYGAEEECEIWDEIEGITSDGYVDIGQYSLPIEEVKTYLFPLSSMTETQQEEHKDLLDNQYSSDANGNIFTLQDFYCKYHLDFRGLIPMKLALDATNLGIY